MILKLLVLYSTALLGEAEVLNSHLQRTNPNARLNVCRQFQYYFSGATDTNECWYNPDVDAHAHDIIKRYGYPFESYKVTSKDNYITTLFRIPRGKHGTSNGQSVFLLHGLATSSHIMVDVGKRCLAFALADAGYDVWIGNLRGSTYSVGHTNLSYVNNDYWNFSFHEMGKYDLPATLGFIANKIKQKVIFIGHSIAASVFHVFEDYHRSLSKDIVKVAILVAPVVYLANIQPIHKELTKYGNPLMVLATLLGLSDNSTFSSTILDFTTKFCNKNMPPMLGACNNGFYMSFGLGTKNIPAHHIPLMLAHNPSGFAVNTLNHLIQIAHNDGIFQEYDYGVKQNQILYDDVFPREYSIQDCDTPILVFFGAGDWLSTEMDINRLLKTIPTDKIKGKYKIKSDVWKHMDYFYGKNAPNLFYKPLLEQLEEFINNSPSKQMTSRKDANILPTKATTITSPASTTSTTTTTETSLDHVEASREPKIHFEEHFVDSASSKSTTPTTEEALTSTENVVIETTTYELPTIFPRYRA